MPERTPKFKSISEALELVGYKIEEKIPKTIWKEAEWARRLREEGERKK